VLAAANVALLLAFILPVSLRPCLAAFRQARRLGARRRCFALLAIAVLWPRRLRPAAAAAAASVPRHGGARRPGGVSPARDEQTARIRDAAVEAAGAVSTF